MPLSQPLYRSQAPRAPQGAQGQARRRRRAAAPRGACRPDVRPSVMARKYPHVEHLLKEYARQHIPDFPYTTITINHNLKCKKHLDTSNHGASAITSVGEFTGGQLNIASGDTYEKFDTRHRFVIYDGGRCMHWNDDIVGDKYSIVYYCNRSILQHARKHSDDPRFETLASMTAATADRPYYAC